MKNNIFQKMLSSIFAVAALLLANSVSAYKCQPKDFVGSCGIFAEDEVQEALDRAQSTKPDARVMTQKFLQVTMKAWLPEFGCIVFKCWPFWTNEQKQKVIDRMYEQGIISLEQVENWKNSPYPPCVEPNRDRIDG
jgi:hypothetical protein